MTIFTAVDRYIKKEDAERQAEEPGLFFYQMREAIDPAHKYIYRKGNNIETLEEAGKRLCDAANGSYGKRRLAELQKELADAATDDVTTIKYAAFGAVNTPDGLSVAYLWKKKKGGYGFAVIKEPASQRRKRYL